MNNKAQLDKDEVVTLAKMSLNNLRKVVVTQVGDVFVTTIVNTHSDDIDTYTSWRLNFKEGTASAIDFVVVNKSVDKLVSTCAIDGPVIDFSNIHILKLIAKAKTYLKGLASLNADQKSFVENA